MKSRKLSAKVKYDHGDFGALTHEESVLTTIFDKKVRSLKQKYYMAWGVLNVALCIYIIALECYFWKYLDALECIR